MYELDVETTLDLLMKSNNILTWRVEYYDNGAEEYTTFIGNTKQINIVSNEMGDYYIVVTCLFTNKINKTWLEKNLKTKVKDLIQDISNRRRYSSNLWKEVNAVLEKLSV